MISPRLIIRLLILMMIITYGCTTNTQSKVESSEALNQIGPLGRKQGPWEIYEDTVIVARGAYVDNQPDGLWTSWYPNGQMKAEGHYINGVKNGMWVEWYPDGEVMWKGEWDHGTQKIENIGTTAEILFLDQDQGDGVLRMNSLYHLQIRILNIPSSYLFVEVSSGKISRDKKNTDQFILHTSSDTMLTLAIGYMPDPDFMDFRNLVSEIDFKLR